MGALGVAHPNARAGTLGMGSRYRYELSLFPVRCVKYGYHTTRLVAPLKRVSWRRLEARQDQIQLPPIDLCEAISGVIQLLDEHHESC